MSRPNILVLGLMDEDYLADLFAFLMSSMRAVAQGEYFQRRHFSSTNTEKQSN